MFRKQTQIVMLNTNMLSLKYIWSTDSVRLTTAFGSDHPVVSRSGRKSNLIYTCMYILYVIYMYVSRTLPVQSYHES